MTVKELKDLIIELNIPDDAIVNCNCDHGQDTEEAFMIEFTRSTEGDPHACVWQDETTTKEDLLNFYYDEDIVNEYDFTAPIKQIVLYAN